MRKFFTTAILIIMGTIATLARITSSEYSQLTPEQRTIYDRQYGELTRVLKSAKDDLYRAEDIIKMGQEMKSDNAGAAGAAHIARGVAMKERALQEIREAENSMRLLDDAARDAIRRNR